VSRPAIEGSAPLRWCAAAGLGLYRSAVLVALFGPVFVLWDAVAFFGTEFALSWSSQLNAPLIVRVLADAGEVVMGLIWTAAIVWLTVRLAGPRLSRKTRSLALDWLDRRIEVTYRQPPPVTQMVTGFWWNGFEYHRTEKEARDDARGQQLIRDPQLYWDGLGIGIFTLTVLPWAALPLLGLAAGIYLTLQPGLAAWGAVSVVAGLAIAPFAWRCFGPVAAIFFGPAPRSRIKELTEIQADVTKAQAVELERIERGLHDGAQARIVALGLSVGAAEHLLDTDPEAARAILVAARESSAAALAELRALVRGINPPVLAERGLVDAVRALALDAPVPVVVAAAVPSRPERPVESAVYFAVSELLVNVAKHAHATQVGIDLGYDGKMLTATVTDNGVGGAASSSAASSGTPGAGDGSGLRGIERRLAAFGGRLEINSPAGGPTRIIVAVPCVLLSPRICSCSGTALSVWPRRTGTRWWRQWEPGRPPWTHCSPPARTSRSWMCGCRRRSPTRACRRRWPRGGRYPACRCSSCRRTSSSCTPASYSPTAAAASATSSRTACWTPDSSWTR
jgi:signal transduction histidine kinase